MEETNLNTKPENEATANLLQGFLSGTQIITINLTLGYFSVLFKENLDSPNKLTEDLWIAQIPK